MKRLPIPVLRPFVALLWASDAPAGEPYDRPVREHVLPGGTMHLVFRLADSPLRIVDPPCTAGGQPLDLAIVGGARSRYYVREMQAPSCSVGAVLRPGAAAVLFDVAANELAERHTPLADLWPSAARGVHERLLEAGNAERRLAVLESELTARLPPVRILHPAIASVIDRMHSLSVEAAVALSGVSHRNFIALFRQTTGLPPKTYLRILRFQRALASLSHVSGTSLATLAAHAGYSDQAHFHRDFVPFTGVTPGAYRAFAPVQMNHLPMETQPTPRG